MIYESSNAATQRVFRALTRTQAGPDLGTGEYAKFRERRLAVKRWLHELGSPDHFSCRAARSSS
jgi:hypothetical protein